MNARLTSDEAHELWLYASNTQPVWRQLEHYFRLLQRKQALGVYDHALAVKGAARAVTDAARRYSREFSFGNDWPLMFPVHVRLEVAEVIVSDFEAEIAAGNSWLPENVT